MTMGWNGDYGLARKNGEWRMENGEGVRSLQTFSILRFAI